MNEAQEGRNEVHGRNEAHRINEGQARSPVARSNLSVWIAG